MVSSIAWHSLEQQVHHNHGCCLDGFRIDPTRRLIGNGRKPLCSSCAALRGADHSPPAPRRSEASAPRDEARASQWRQRAQTLRARAATHRDGSARARLLGMARDFEHRADLATLPRRGMRVGGLTPHNEEQQ